MSRGLALGGHMPGEPSSRKAGRLTPPPREEGTAKSTIAIEDSKEDDENNVELRQRGAIYQDLAAIANRFEEP